MRLNKYIANSTSLSRRAADAAIVSGRVLYNGQPASVGDQVKQTDVILLDGKKITPRSTHATIILHKPVGYVCSRNGQGSDTVYSLLPPELHHLKPVGRLDKDSSGLLLMTDDGQLAEQLTHPRYNKTKVYEVTLDKPLQPLHQQMISDYGVTLEDGLSKFLITKLETREAIVPLRGDKKISRSDVTLRTSNVKYPTSTTYEVHMHEGRNRQIRRTFAALGYTVTTLHRTHFGPYTLGETPTGNHLTIL